ncbi:MAG: hypothetical protein L0Y67_02610 [Gammaproteobacteria bacterium]|nr:hypothetical protein [Gammaproteobacteria bacterium]MCI0590488.1 hypothetical protein [Gammaproteobacteria bacterium]
MEDVLKIPAPVPGSDELGAALGRISAPTRAAEWHGMLYGQICVQGGVDEGSCLRELVGEREVITGERGECWAVLRALIRDTLGQFGSRVGVLSLAGG